MNHHHHHHKRNSYFEKDLIIAITVIQLVLLANTNSFLIRAQDGLNY